uniref:Myomesin 1 n=1 Tax=Sander lucioperca TaxID=283035 RepID=A0A8D0A2S9_SANLU
MSGSMPFYQKHHRHYDRGYRSRETESKLSQYQTSSRYTFRETEQLYDNKSLGPVYLCLSRSLELDKAPHTQGRQLNKHTHLRIGSTRINEDSLMHAPEFVIKPRSHTVWEKQCVRLHCTVSGWPDPRVVWYKNNVAIDPIGNAGKYKLESRYIGALILFHALSVDGPVSEYGINFQTHIVDKFGVSFGREGETMSLGCTVIIYPTLHLYKPEVQWYRDDVLLSPSKWNHMHWSGDRATLTLTHLNKEDEGLYTLRVTTKSGYETYSAYVFVKDADAEVERAPGAPLDVRCLDANKDYIIVTWKQPAVDGGDSILGYFVDRCEVGTTHWIQCNDTPVKFARFPVTGLVEGRSYLFRVRAINKSGMSRPSRVSEPVAAMDPSDRARTSAPWTGQIIVTEEEPAEGVVPGRPLELQVTEATKNYVVLSWNPPGEKGLEGVMYYVEKCVSGTDSWQRVNTEIPVKSPRFALFDLAEGKSYSFRVRCCNSAGVGEPSDPTEAITVGDKLDIPSAPSKVVPTRNTDTSVVVSWVASSEAKELVGYYIEGSIEGSNVWEPCNNKPVKATRFICHGLMTGEKYMFRVRAVNAAGLSQFSPESEAVEVKAAIGGGIPHASPAPPYGITVLECVCDSMVLAWKQPSFIGGADITGYFVDYREVTDGVPGKWHEANIKAISDRAYRVSDLKENRKYQFQVRAANMAGVGIPSLPSNTFLCEEWTIAVPGPPHDLQVREVRNDSLVLLWKPPVYQGRDPVNGFYIDIKEADAPEEVWRGVNNKATEKTFIKVNLKEGERFVFRVRAQNKAGVGECSDVTEPVPALTKPGTKEIVVDVNDDGIISLNYEFCDLTPDSKFVWSKNYEEITDSSRLTIETKGNKSKAIFNTLEEEDIGIYSCLVTHTDGASSSYNLSEEELKRLLEVSHDHKFPIIPLKSELAVELLEKGKVRFWLQADKISANGKVDYIFNEKMNFDKNTGVIEMIMESLTPADEGTFTFQLQDGKATNQSSLVLIGDVTVELHLHDAISISVTVMFVPGPHFIEYLGYEVTPECCVILKCKVGNVKKETSAHWYKDGREIKSDEHLGFTEGVLKLEISYHVSVFPRLGFRDSAIAFSDRIKSGVVGEQLWLQITEPTEKDMGKYAIEFNDGKGGLRRTVELSGQGETIIISIFESSLLATLIVCLGRARVAGGLPDVVTIQEGKALNLTCNISGDPVPEVTWLKNDREITSDDHCILKFASGKFASFIITGVNTSDSGKYSILVKNKYGTESGDFTVSVFIPDEAGGKKNKSGPNLVVNMYK